MKGQEWQLHQRKGVGETGMAVLIRGTGILVLIVTGAITFYLFYKGILFFLENGMGTMLLNCRWEPTGRFPWYGISYMIGASVFGSFGAMAVAMPAGVAIAVYIEEFAPKRLSVTLEIIIELMAGVPSIVYGLAGLVQITPVLYQWEKKWIADNTAFYIPSGGSNLLAAIFVLAIMILPTIIMTSKEAVKAVPERLKREAMALGASKVEAIIGVKLKSAYHGIVTAGILGFGRVLGETMAVSLVAGGCVNFPVPFASVRFLTTALVSEMGYAEGNHRKALFSIGLILYILIMLLIGGVHEFTKSRQKEKSN